MDVNNHGYHHVHIIVLLYNFFSFLISIYAEYSALICLGDLYLKENGYVKCILTHDVIV